MTFRHYVVQRQNRFGEWQQSCFCGWRGSWRQTKQLHGDHPHLTATRTRTDMEAA